jgi:formate hydrogenlyase subunit 6/NADH:ubiquinone oxidoreductase subunit I
MKICPTNIIQPALLQAGVEGLWTPVLNFRIGTSGCELNCIACGHVCPTAAIRPLTTDEKTGRGAFSAEGPVRMGLAFVDRGRCLPWAMETPCIVCQEVCPISPKAIHLREVFETVRDGQRSIAEAAASRLAVDGPSLAPGALGGGDHYALGEGWAARRRIVANTAREITLEEREQEQEQSRERVQEGMALDIQVRLQQPLVDPALCTGCGICEHACPVAGFKAIRVTAENESRHPSHSVLARRAREP